MEAFMAWKRYGFYKVKRNYIRINSTRERNATNEAFMTFRHECFRKKIVILLHYV